MAVTVLDARALRTWFEHALRSLLLVRAEVDRLNVFPVPDADTGTNLVLTMAGAARAARGVDAETDLATMTRLAADGALLGARGNSGVMIAQAMTAVATSLSGSHELDGPALARALDAAAGGAREAVAEPAGGTMLTVAEAAARAACRCVDEAAGQKVDGPLPTEVAEAAARAAREALRATRGVHGSEAVDAGAAGYVVLLTALVDVLEERASGTRCAEQVRAVFGPDGHAGAHAPAAHRGGHESAFGGAFEVMYVLHADAEIAQNLRERLCRVGDSVAVVGRAQGGSLWHVHVHTDTPAEALCAEGRMEQVCVRDLEPLLTAEADDATVGVVACTNVPGLIEPLARTGAVVVLHGDRAGIRRAVADLGTSAVRILPCDERSRQAAMAVMTQPNATPHRERQDVRVGSTTTDLAVLTAAAEVRTCTEEGAVDGVLERALAGLRTTALGAEPTAPLSPADAAAALTALLADGADLATAVLGRGVGADVADALRGAAEDAGTELLILAGGQASPLLLLGVE